MGQEINIVLNTGFLHCVLNRECPLLEVPLYSSIAMIMDDSVANLTAHRLMGANSLQLHNLFPYTTNTFLAADTVRIVPGHIPLVVINE